MFFFFFFSFFSIQFSLKQEADEVCAAVSFVVQLAHSGPFSDLQREMENIKYVRVRSGGFTRNNIISFMYPVTAV